MGAAGLSCATSETGSRGGVGIEIDVAKVPQRETGMTPYEIMLSESQERMLLVAEKRDAEAATELREAIHSPTNGFTRVNYELGRVLIRLGRAEEAVPVVRAALHGDLDGSSLYMSRTELHELLAEAFAAAGKPDSAAVHYGAVASAWEHADPVFTARRDQARAWLAKHAPSRAMTRR